MERGDVYYSASIDMIFEILYIDHNLNLCMVAHAFENGEFKFEVGELKILQQVDKILIDHLDAYVKTKNISAKVIKTNILFNKKNYKEVAERTFLFHKTAMFDVGNGQYIYVYREKFKQDF